MSIAFETGFNAVKRSYLKGVMFFLHHRWVAPAIVVLGAALLVYNMKVTKTGLIPQEDMGVVRVDVSTPPGSSLSYTKDVMNRIDRDVIQDIDEKRAYENSTGFGLVSGTGSSHGSFTIRLKPWDERPEIGSISTSFNPNFPQFELDLDHVKCKRAGISPKEVLEVLNGYYGGRMSTKFNRFTKLYQVMVQADSNYREDKQSLNNVFVRIGDEMAPISQFVTLTKIYAPESLTRFNLFPCIKVNGRAAEGFSSGEAIRAVREVASETLPFAVILILPFGLAGSFLLARSMGLENNIYLQTGLVMLIGLLAKTSILITEYAVMKRREGLGIAAAALYATKERFRPIMMTVLTMIVGLFPLIVASGVGANGNNTLGAGVIGGMFLGTLGILFMVPSLFTLFEWLQEKVSPAKFKEQCELARK